jgi:5-formyltetrahydrofolate cyclo-ligase
LPRLFGCQEYMNMSRNDKALLRKAMRELSEPAGRFEEGKAAADHLCEWPVFKQADIVGCFSSLRYEIDTQPVLNAILSAGKTLALPRTYEKGIMEFCRVEDPAFLHPGRLGILEPGTDAQIIPPEAFSLLLIPALAVDLNGRRLGHGGGYYDRFLVKTRCTLAALVLSRQVVSTVPCEERDYLVQWIITGDGILPAKMPAQA